MSGRLTNHFISFRVPGIGYVLLPWQHSTQMLPCWHYSIPFHTVTIGRKGTSKRYIEKVHRYESYILHEDRTFNEMFEIESQISPKKQKCKVVRLVTNYCKY